MTNSNPKCIICLTELSHTNKEFLKNQIPICLDHSSCQEAILSLAVDAFVKGKLDIYTESEDLDGFARELDKDIEEMYWKILSCRLTDVIEAQQGTEKGHECGDLDEWEIEEEGQEERLEDRIASIDNGYDGEFEQAALDVIRNSLIDRALDQGNKRQFNKLAKENWKDAVIQKNRKKGRAKAMEITDHDLPF